LTESQQYLPPNPVTILTDSRCVNPGSCTLQELLSYGILQRGDLLWFDSRLISEGYDPAHKITGHVGIYENGTTMIDAFSDSINPHGIRRDDLLDAQPPVGPTYWTDRFMFAGRVVMSAPPPDITNSGSAAILAGTVNGQAVDKAYLPAPSLGRIAVINVDSTSSNTALLKSITLPPGYAPNASAANAATQQVVVVSYSSPAVQIIDASQDLLSATLTSPVTQSAFFSGGSCMICGVLIDPSTNSAILDTAQGYLLLNLTTQTFSSFLTGTVAGENFGFNPKTQFVLNPTYSQIVPAGLQLVNLTNDSVFIYTQSVGANPRRERGGHHHEHCARTR